tara:strand:- start:94 stop:273 length:180 start_codon:yes stop_codon:yes gene_type:complete
MKLSPDFWRKKKEKCFLCSGPLGKNSGEIVYNYQDGEGKVQVCEVCLDKIEENQDEQTI